MTRFLFVRNQRIDKNTITNHNAGDDFALFSFQCEFPYRNKLHPIEIQIKFDFRTNSLHHANIIWPVGRVNRNF